MIGIRPGRDVITRLLDKDELKRLGSKSGASEVKQHKWFAKINWGLLRNTQPPVCNSFLLDYSLSFSSTSILPRLSRDHGVLNHMHVTLNTLSKDSHCPSGFTNSPSVDDTRWMMHVQVAVDLNHGAMIILITSVAVWTMTQARVGYVNFLPVYHSLGILHFGNGGRNAADLTHVDKTPANIAYFHTVTFPNGIDFQYVLCLEGV